MQYIITEQTINKIIGLLEEKPFKEVISLLNEIKAIPNIGKDNDDLLNNNIGGQDADIN
jgi:hypothetical protein